MLQIMPYTGTIDFQKSNHGPHVFHDALEKGDEEDVSKMSFDIFSGMSIRL